MRTTDAITIRAPHERVFALARDVERWPALLAHYRWVHVLSREPRARSQVVEMAAWRPFGPLRCPVPPAPQSQYQSHQTQESFGSPALVAPFATEPALNGAQERGF